MKVKLVRTHFAYSLDDVAQLQAGKFSRVAQLLSFVSNGIYNTLYVDSKLNLQLQYDAKLILFLYAIV